MNLLYGSARRLFRDKVISSYPYLTGDTFQKQCDISLSESKIAEILRAEHIVSIKNLFVASKNVHLVRALVGSSPDKSLTKHINLVIHNGDQIPAFKEYEEWGAHFQSIFSVNWFGNLSVATPLPIGLENRNLFQNGRLGGYKRLVRRGLPVFNERDKSIVANFSLHTNEIERKLALSYALDSGLSVHTERQTSLMKYLRQVASSQFVLSPPGNGADCHRTWEAMYLGAIPIVKRSFWPFAHLPLPVLIVDEWHEINMSVKSFQLTPEVVSFNWRNYFSTLLTNS